MADPLHQFEIVPVDFLPPLEIAGYDISFTNFAVFDLKIPSFCPDVPGDILHPRNSWADKEEYSQKRLELAQMFKDNFKKFEDKVSLDIKEAAPSENKVLA